MINGYINVPKTLIDEINEKLGATSGMSAEVEIDMKPDYLDFLAGSTNKIVVWNGTVNFGGASANVNIVMNRIFTSFVMNFIALGNTVVFEIDFENVVSENGDYFILKAKYDIGQAS